MSVLCVHILPLTLLEKQNIVSVFWLFHVLVNLLVSTKQDEETDAVEKFSANKSYLKTV